MKSGPSRDEISEKAALSDFMSAYLQYVFEARTYFFSVPALHGKKLPFDSNEFMRNLAIPQKYIRDNYVRQSDTNKPIVHGIQNVHLTPLNADENRWFSGAWHILLPNLMSLFVIATTRNATLRTQFMFLFPYILSKDSSFANIRISSPGDLAPKINLIKETYFSDQEKDPLGRVHDALEKMKPLINLHIMCKIGEENLRNIQDQKIKENVAPLFENIQSFVFSLIQNTLHETLTNPKENLASCNLSVINENNRFICDTITDESIARFRDFLRQTESENTYFGKTLIAFATAMKNKDEKAILNLLKLTSHYNDLSKSAPQKEQVEPNISEKLRGKEPEKPQESKEKRKSLTFSSMPIKSPSEQHIDELTLLLTEMYGLPVDKTKTLSENATNSGEGTSSERDNKLLAQIENAFAHGRDIDDVIAEQFKEIASPHPRR